MIAWREGDLTVMHEHKQKSEFLWHEMFAFEWNGHSTLTKSYFALNWIRGAFAFSPFCSIFQP